MTTNNPTPLPQAIFGPIMLITLGTLLALDHAGLYGFSRTWPALLIVGGILKLFARMIGGTFNEGGQS